MNNTQRKKIKELISSIDVIKQQVETMMFEEENKLSNLPDSLQESERGEKMQDSIGNLDDAASYLEIAVDYLEDAMGDE